MRIQIEHRASRELHVLLDQGRIQVQREQRLPHFLVNGQAVRIVRQRREQKVERLAMTARRS